MADQHAKDRNPLGTACSIWRSSSQKANLFTAATWLIQWDNYASEHVGHGRVYIQLEERETMVSGLES